MQVKSKQTTIPNIKNRRVFASSRLRVEKDWLLIALLLLAGLAGAWLPVGWTRDLKRIQQPNWYIGLGVAYALVYGLAVWWLWRRDDKTWRGRWLSLTILVLLPNLLNIWLRFSSELGPGQSLFGRDSDVGLFFKYGHDFATGQPPTFNGNPMEYPQGALFIFWVAERLAGGDLTRFYWVFPLWMLVWQGVAAAALYGLGHKVGQARAAFLLTAFAASCPFLYQLNYTRFDIVPAALLLVAVYFFVPRRATLGQTTGPAVAGVAIGAGFLVKWLPAVIAPWLAVAYVQAKRWRDLIILSVSSLVVALVVMLPFYLADAERFWYPYKFQASRNLIGESCWFLVQYHLFDPAKTQPEKPWGEPGVVILGNNKLLVAQLGLVAVVFGLSLWRLWRAKVSPDLYQRWAAAGLVGVAVFTLANRIFSPQYMVMLVWILAAALILRPVGWRVVGFAIGLLTIATGANFLVFHLGAFPTEWIKYSLILFVTAWLLCGWLLWRATKAN